VKQLLRNPKARIAVLAALVLGGAYFLMRGKGAPADPTAGLPVQPTTTLGAGDSLGSGFDLGGSVGGTTTAPTAEFGDNGLQQAIDAIKAQVTDATDALNAAVMPGTYAVPDAVYTDSGASNPTKSPTVSGDGSSAVPGNRIAASSVKPAGRNKLQRMAALLAADPATRAGDHVSIVTKFRKKKRNRAKTPRVGVARVAVTRSGAIVVSQPRPSANAIAIVSGRSGYTAPSRAVPRAQAAGAVQVRTSTGGAVITVGRKAPAPLLTRRAI
jgi:hypothetical protein